MEDDPLPELNQRGRVDCPSAIRSVTCPYPSSRMPPLFSRQDRPQAQHRGPSYARARGVVGLAGATTESRLFDGGEVLIEVVQYLDPVGKPRPHDHRLSDQGILNIAFGARRKADFDTVYRRAEAFGASPIADP